MKKVCILASMAALGLGVFAADTDLLVWSINVRSNDEIKNKQFTDVSQFYITDGTHRYDIGAYTYTDVNLTSASPNLDAYVSQSLKNGRTGAYYTDIGAILNQIVSDTGLESVKDINYGAWEFFMQLDNNGNMVAWSEHLYDPSADAASRLYLADVTGSIFQPGNMLNPVVPSGFNFGTHLVPEPTSGLLMMLGAGLLALRRRRRA